jgi:hypothetical protein
MRNVVFVVLLIIGLSSAGARSQYLMGPPIPPVEKISFFLHSDDSEKVHVVAVKFGDEEDGPFRYRNFINYSRQWTNGQNSRGYDFIYEDGKIYLVPDRSQPQDRYLMAEGTAEQQAKLHQMQEDLTTGVHRKRFQDTADALFVAGVGNFETDYSQWRRRAPTLRWDFDREQWSPSIASIVSERPTYSPSERGSKKWNRESSFSLPSWSRFRTRRQTVVITTSASAQFTIGQQMPQVAYDRFNKDLYDESNWYDEYQLLARSVGMSPQQLATKKKFPPGSGQENAFQKWCSWLFN